MILRVFFKIPDGNWNLLKTHNIDGKDCYFLKRVALREIGYRNRKLLKNNKLPKKTLTLK
jgi:hypothetical protein